MFDKLIELIVASLETFQFWTVINPYERAVLIRLGQFKEELAPGFHWRLPFHIDAIHSEHVVPRTERISGLATTTADGRSIGFDAVVTYRISDIQKALLEVEDLKDAIADSCAGTIGQTLSAATWEAIWKGEATDNLTAVCRKKGWRWGVEIQSVQLTGVVPLKSLRIVSSGTTHHTMAPVQG
jgi:regulator of protease activity HflC (stomatin/prohibitin superfamily)